MDKEQKAIERIKIATEMSLQHYGKPLICTYSGGKDSDVLLELFKRSGVIFEVQHSHTTVDAPQTVYHVRNKFRELEQQGIQCNIEMPMYKGKRVTMWSLIPQKKMPPTRLARYCCQILKETGGKNRFIATGVRWDESNQRKTRKVYETSGVKKKVAIRLSDETINDNAKDDIRLFDDLILNNDNDSRRKMTEHCQLQGKMVLNPIIDWNNSDIWEYIQSEMIETNPLYKCGYNRVGCVGCPMANKHRRKEFSDFPTYKNAYIRAFDRMLEVLKQGDASKIRNWKTGQDVFDWWMQDNQIEGQMNLEDFI